MGLFLSLVEAAVQVENQQDKLRTISDFLINNNDANYFYIPPCRKYFDHTQYYYYKKTKTRFYNQDQCEPSSSIT